MKILIINSFESMGGAAKAANRLCQALSMLGIDVKYLVAKRSTFHKKILSPWSFLCKPVALFFSALDKLPLLFYPRRTGMIFSPAIFSTNLSSWAQKLDSDIVHLHWIVNGFVGIDDITKFRKPIVWTLHDSWAFTGGCHLPFDCKRYQDSCGACPELGSSNPKDLSHQIWKKKAAAWDQLNIQVVSPSRWLANCAQSSSLFKDRSIQIIPNGVDTELYKPRNKDLAREQIGLPKGKKLVLLSAMWVQKDRNKGHHFLKPILQSLSNQKFTDLEFVIIGSMKSELKLDFGFPVHYLGTLNNENAIASLYAAVDLTLLLSLQENLPNAVMESLSCATPVVAFNIGGVPDMVDHQSNGYLAKPYEVEDIVRGIIWILEDEDRYRKLSEQARKKCEDHFTLELQAKRYAELYKNILSR